MGEKRNSNIFFLFFLDPSNAENLNTTNVCGVGPGLYKELVKFSDKFDVRPKRSRPLRTPKSPKSPKKPADTVRPPKLAKIRPRPPKSAKFRGLDPKFRGLADP